MPPHVRPTHSPFLGCLIYRIVTARPTLANALVDFKATDLVCGIAVVAMEPVASDGDLLVLTVRRRDGAGDTATLTASEVAKHAPTAASRCSRVSVRPGRVSTPTGVAVGTRSGITSSWMIYLHDVIAGVASSPFTLTVVGLVLAMRRRRNPQ